MKNLNLKVILAIFFSLFLLNAFGQVRKKGRPKKTAQTQADTATQKKLNAFILLTQAANSKADSIAKTLKANTDSVKKEMKGIKDSMAKAKKIKDTTGMGQYREKSYTFQKDIRIVESNEVGEISKSPNRPIAPKGTTFTVQGVTPNGELVISFWIWGLNDPLTKNLEEFESNQGGGQKQPLLASIIDSAKTRKEQMKLSKEMDIIAKRKTFNFKDYAEKLYVPVSVETPNSNKRYFVIGKDTLAKYCVEYKETKKWEINFGALVTPFKLRFNRFSFSNNLSVGGAVYYQKKFDADWSWGGVLALSLSSVTLDPASTNIHQNAAGTNPPLKTSTTRPAFSPSVHYVLSYKTINLTAGVGFDYISKPTNIATATNPEAGWIYNGKPWLGIGLGVSLFNNNTTKPAQSDPAQKAKQ